MMEVEFSEKLDGLNVFLTCTDEEIERWEEYQSEIIVHFISPSGKKFMVYLPQLLE